jgi:CelD/BcsL family acetyltransferase involved in cellulose biosynthesis
MRTGTANIVIDIASDLRSIEQEWRLFEQSADCTAFQSFAWLSTWQECIGNRTGVRPAIVTGRRANGELLFILPLATEKMGPARRLTFLGHDLGDYNAPLLAPAYADDAFGRDFLALWQRITQRLQGDPLHRHDLVVLDKMPKRVGHQPNPFCSLPCRPNASGAYLATLATTWDEFYQAKRSGGSRKRDRQRQRRLAEFGPAAMVTAQTPEEARTTLAILIAQKRQAFARMGVPDIFAHPGYIEFFETIATRQRDFVHVSQLQVGATLAATNLGLMFRDKFYHVLISYDAGPVARVGPGTAHLQELMRYAIGHGCAAFDFTIGDEPYKREWADVEMTLYDYVAPTTALGWFLAAPLNALRAMKRRIKHSPRLWAAVTKMRALLGKGSAGAQCADTNGKSGKDT